MLALKICTAFTPFAVKGTAQQTQRIFLQQIKCIEVR